jgi:hypothetical protein
MNHTRWHVRRGSALGTGLVLLLIGTLTSGVSCSSEKKPEEIAAKQVPAETAALEERAKSLPNDLDAAPAKPAPGADGGSGSGMGRGTAAGKGMMSPLPRGAMPSLPAPPVSSHTGPGMPGAPATPPYLTGQTDPEHKPEPVGLVASDQVQGLRGKSVSKRDSDASVASKPQIWHQDGRRPSFARVYVGDGNALELVSLQVTVTVEGPRARTVVDHIFRNPYDRRLEGTFEYPLPTGASPSYFAMFLGQQRDTAPPRFGQRGDVPPLPADKLASLPPAELVKNISTADWGPLQEARIVGKVKALETYEEIVRGRIDPALLEYAGGNTFSGRVFPIQAKGYNRVIIAYEELLPFAQERVLYRFPLPDCKVQELQFALSADPAECQQVAFGPGDAEKSTAGGRVAFRKSWKDNGPGGDALFTYVPAQPQIQVLSGRQGESGPIYLMARVRPELRIEAATPYSDHAVFLLDTSLSEHPDRFAVNMKLLRKILETDPTIKRFNILTFNVAGAWVEPNSWLENNPTGRERAFARVDGLVLEGATDLSAALDNLITPRFLIEPGTRLNVFMLSDGQITWGESDIATLVARFESRCPFPTRFHCYRTGLGADNLELFEALTRQGGGIFNCYGDTDLNAAAAAHRNQCLQIEKVKFTGGSTSDVLVAGRKAAVYPGGDVLVAARVNQPGKLQLVIEGQFLGKKFAQEYPIEVASAAELAPRAWAEVAVASLLSLNDPNLDSLVTAYCQQFGVGSKVASFLVLENENDYKRLNLQDERGKLVPGGDLGMFLDEAWQRLGRALPAKEAFQQFFARMPARFSLLSGPNATEVQRLLNILEPADYELPASNLDGALLHANDVAANYLTDRERDLRNVGPYLTEARRRANAKDTDGAVRVLSSVIEQFPSRPDALRLVGYRLLDLHQAAQAARLFQQVQRNRPFEPHSYRDLARSLEECGKFGLAALYYEMVLTGQWHARFASDLKTVALEEYARMMNDAIRRKDVAKELKNVFGNRLEALRGVLQPSDLRVVITWNTDATDIDLWVIEPDGTKCFYQHQRTKNGGQLSQDQTQGYGPERYQALHALKGAYTIIVHYYRANPNLLAGETHVNVAVTRNAGTPQEATERHNVILKKHDEQAEVCKVKFGE